MSCYTHQVADPCPNCGKLDSARMSSREWGHGYSCCSDECGRAFAHSSARWRMELQSAKMDLKMARLKVRDLERELYLAQEREQTP